MTLAADHVLPAGHTIDSMRAEAERAYALDRAHVFHSWSAQAALNPMTITQFMLVGKASAWTGSIVGGIYAGIAVYVIPNVSTLAAASDDLVGVIASALGGLAMSAAGLRLERHCETPPPPDGVQAVH